MGVCTVNEEHCNNNTHKAHESMDEEEKMRIDGSRKILRLLVQPSSFLELGRRVRES